jgi:hypothetical protein
MRAIGQSRRQNELRTSVELDTVLLLILKKTPELGGGA